MTMRGEMNPLAGHHAAVVLRTIVGCILDPSPVSWRDPEPKPPDATGLEALRKELEIQLGIVTDRIRRGRLAVVEDGAGE